MMGVTYDGFSDNATHKVTSDGCRYEIACRKGLWSVSAPTQEQAIKEALHYYIQYKSDGEYSGVDKNDIIRRAINNLR